MNYLYWGCSSAGRAPPLQGGSQGFESPQLHLAAIFVLLLLYKRSTFLSRIIPETAISKYLQLKLFINFLFWGLTLTLRHSL
jgi:hypothetical protein